MSPRNTVISVVATGTIYIAGAWVTVGYTAMRLEACRTSMGSMDSYYVFQKCGDGLVESVQTVLWPLYWFGRSAQIVWGVK